MTGRFGDDEIMTVNSDGTDLRRLTVPAKGHSPTWSPDGSRILFTSTLEGRIGLTLMNPDGSGQVRLTTRGDDHSAAWRP